MIGNDLSGSLPALAKCLPRLTRINIEHKDQLTLFNALDTRGLTGRIPEWLLSRLDSGSMSQLYLADNAFDDPTDEASAYAIRTLWAQCSTGTDCTGVPPRGCSAFNRAGKRYEVALSGTECIKCPTALETFIIAGVFVAVILAIGVLIKLFARFMRRYPEHARTHVASVMIVYSHLQVRAHATDIDSDAGSLSELAILHLRAPLLFF